MRGAKILLLALLFAQFGCASVERRSSTPDVYVMRHLHTPAGASDPDLTSEGQRVAQLLIGWFKRDRPNVIYVSDTRRGRQTAEPLAQSRNITLKIYRPSDVPGLVAAVSRETGTVLIVGHSNTVPEIIERLGGQRPTALVHEDFGDIWRLTGSPHVTQRFSIGG